MLDSVEWNVMEAAKEVKGGEEELVVARRSVYLISNIHGMTLING